MVGFLRLLLVDINDGVLCSAYCGGLWLAALRSMVEAARVLDFEEDRLKYSNILNSATEAYNKRLWNG